MAGEQLPPGIKAGTGDGENDIEVDPSILDVVIKNIEIFMLKRGIILDESTSVSLASQVLDACTKSVWFDELSEVRILDISMSEKTSFGYVEFEPILKSQLHSVTVDVEEISE